MGVFDKFMNGVKAFREAWVNSGGDASGINSFGSVEARQLRYAMNWSYYENNAYRDIHTWATKMKSDYGLYRYTRNIYNPTYRIVSFYRAHIWGGALDYAAGDGRITPSAIPIATDNDKIRLAIGALWRSSNWASEKGIVAQDGAIYGDVAIRIIDDPSRGKVFLQAVKPSTIKNVTVDSVNNVKGYEIECKRIDPRNPTSTIIYNETATRDGEDVVYTTRLNGAVYAYPENMLNGAPVAEWREPYGFIPLVIAKHNHVGLDWGWAEIHPALSKIREVDDVASKVSDQIRKMVDSGWLFSGVKKPDNTPTMTGRSNTADRPESGREETPALYATDPQAKAMPLVAPLDIASALQHIGNINSELEREFPELQMDIWNSGGDTSGRALRLARQRVTQKVFERRPSYDDALTRAMQMAISIGGYRGYEGHKGFGLDSYKRGDLEFHIGNRPVFEVDRFEKLEESKLFWETANTAIKTGMPLIVYLKREGWSNEEIAEITRSAEYTSRLALLGDLGGNQPA